MEKEASVFTKYPSIDNVKNGLVRKFTAGIEAEPWVALEKIHGANFGLVLTAAGRPSGEVLLQRRTGFLEDKETFYGAERSEMVRALKAKVCALFDLIGVAQHLVVFGELFGSNVQQEIFYGPELQFACFDLCVDGVLLGHTSVVDLCGRTAIPCVVALKCAPLAELVKHYEDIERLSSRYHPQALAEGLILRPAARSHPINTKEPRPILKHKRSAFRERKATAQVTADRQAEDAGADFVTAGRLASVRSKLKADAPFFEVAKALAADAIEDMERCAAAGDDEDYAFWRTAPDALKKRIKKAVTDAAFALVKAGEAAQ